MKSMKSILIWIGSLIKCLFNTNMGRVGLAHIWIVLFLSIYTSLGGIIYLWVAVFGIIILIIYLILGIINGWVVKSEIINYIKKILNNFNKKDA